MKIMFAECCGQLVVPNPEAKKPKACHCGQSHVWWIAPALGILRVWSNSDKKPTILGIHNGLLREDISDDIYIRPEAMKRIIDETPDNYLFKKYESLIVRFRPNATNDVKFATIEEADELGVVT